LFDWVDSSEQTAETTFTGAYGYRHHFRRYLNAAQLNDANFDLEVNFLEYWEHAPDGSVTHFAWVTNLPVTDANLMTLMRGGPAISHNCRHGRQHLSTVLMHLMMLTFLIDQIRQRWCRLFQAVLTAAGSKARLWRKLRARFDPCLIPDWETLSRSIIAPPQIRLEPRDLVTAGRDRACSICILRGKTVRQPPCVR
jgi:hypothetical protein